eukprot:scaffold537_cov175-Amphora_coffeaeformis.AAC.2
MQRKYAGLSRAEQKKLMLFAISVGRRSSHQHRSSDDMKASYLFGMPEQASSSVSFAQTRNNAGFDRKEGPPKRISSSMPSLVEMRGEAVSAINEDSTFEPPIKDGDDKNDGQSTVDSRDRATQLFSQMMILATDQQQQQQHHHHHETKQNDTEESSNGSNRTTTLQSFLDLVDESRLSESEQSILDQTKELLYLALKSE